MTCSGTGRKAPRSLLGTGKVAAKEASWRVGAGTRLQCSALGCPPPPNAAQGSSSPAHFLGCREDGHIYWGGGTLNTGIFKTDCLTRVDKVASVASPIQDGPAEVDWVG